MSPAEVVTPGDVLCAWRKYAGLTLRGVVDELARLHRESPDARAVKVSRPNTLSQWESGHRSPEPAMIRRLGMALGLELGEQDALIGMWRAAGSVVALPPRVHWEHNYRPEEDRKQDRAAQGSPAWVWLRCASESHAVSVSVGWGPWGESFNVPATSAGMLASAPFSLPNPPIRVRFSRPGWADFGNGVIPQGVSDLLAIEALAITNLAHGGIIDPPELTPEEEAEIKRDLQGMRWLGEAKLHVLWEQIKPHLGAMRPSNKAQPLQGAAVVETGWTGALKADEKGNLADQLLQAPEQIRSIRKSGRRLSAEAAAQAANEEDLAGEYDAITSNQIENLERRGTLPAQARIIARLDHVYGMDGYLGIERIFSSQTLGPNVDRQGRWIIKFPDFWVGPIWLQLRAPERVRGEKSEGVLDLYWGPWRRLQLVEDSTIVSTRKSAVGGEKLLAVPPKGWDLIAGTGAVPGAVDINGHWYPISLKTAARIFLDAFSNLKQSGHI